MHEIKRKTAPQKKNQQKIQNELILKIHSAVAPAAACYFTIIHCRLKFVFFLFVLKVHTADSGETHTHTHHSTATVLNVHAIFINHKIQQIFDEISRCTICFASSKNFKFHVAFPRAPLLACQSFWLLTAAWLIDGCAYIWSTHSISSSERKAFP